VNSIEAMKRALAVSEMSQDDGKTREVAAGVKLLLAALAQDVRPSNGFEVWPGVETLADRMGVSKRTAERRKAAAIEAGLINAVPRQGSKGRGRTSDLIRLDFLADQPAHNWRSGQTATNPTGLDDQPANNWQTNPPSSCRGNKKESKKIEQEEENKDLDLGNSASESPEQGFFSDQVGVGESVDLPEVETAKQNNATPTTYESTAPCSPPSPRRSPLPPLPPGTVIVDAPAPGCRREQWPVRLDPRRAVLGAGVVTRSAALAGAARRIRALADRRLADVGPDIGVECGKLTDSLDGLPDHAALPVVAAWRTRMECRITTAALNAPLEAGDGGVWQVPAAESDTWNEAVDAHRQSKPEAA
jgi:Helix-turn-helix domain